MRTRPWSSTANWTGWMSLSAGSPHRRCGHSGKRPANGKRKSARTSSGSRCRRSGAFLGMDRWRDACFVRHCSRRHRAPVRRESAGDRRGVSFGRRRDRAAESPDGGGVAQAGAGMHRRQGPHYFRGHAALPGTRHFDRLADPRRRVPRPHCRRHAAFGGYPAASVCSRLGGGDETGPRG